MTDNYNSDQTFVPYFQSYTRPYTRSTRALRNSDTVLAYHDGFWTISWADAEPVPDSSASQDDESGADDISQDELLRILNNNSNKAVNTDSDHEKKEHANGVV